MFRPTTLTNPRTGLRSTLLDGGLVSNFPIDSLDRADGAVPRWPTFGVTLDPALAHGQPNRVPLAGLPQPPALRLLEQIVSTALVGRDHAHLQHPWVAARTIGVDATTVGVLDFDITPAQTTALYDAGVQAATTFLAGWDFDRYRSRFRSGLGA